MAAIRDSPQLPHPSDNSKNHPLFSCKLHYPYHSLHQSLVDTPLLFTPFSGVGWYTTTKNGVVESSRRGVVEAEGVVVANGDEIVARGRGKRGEEQRGERRGEDKYEKHDSWSERNSDGREQHQGKGVAPRWGVCRAISRSRQVGQEARKKMARDHRNAQFSWSCGSKTPLFLSLYSNIRAERSTGRILLLQVYVSLEDL
eukprot:766088-Hanusia_phi.AAC.5